MRKELTSLILVNVAPIVAPKLLELAGSTIVKDNLAVGLALGVFALLFNLGFVAHLYRQGIREGEDHFNKTHGL